MPSKVIKVDRIDRDLNAELDEALLKAKPLAGRAGEKIRTAAQRKIGNSVRKVGSKIG